MNSRPNPHTQPAGGTAGILSLQPTESSKPIPDPVGENPSSPPANLGSEPAELALVGDFIGLRVWAETLEDVMKARVSINNRAKRGGVSYDMFAPHIEQLEAQEHIIGLALRRAARTLVRAEFPELETWANSYYGIKMDRILPRLLGHLGHPVIAHPYATMKEAPEGHTCTPQGCGKGKDGKPRHLVALQPFRRSLSQLWSYCGHGDPTRQRRKDMTQAEALALGSPRCKMLVWNLATSTVRVPPHKLLSPAVHSTESIAMSPEADPSPMKRANPNEASVRDRFYFRRIYDARRAKTIDRGWTDGHSHADALRIVGKEILRDIWVIANAQSKPMAAALNPESRSPTTEETL